MVTINPPNWSFLGSFGQIWTASRQVVAEPWTSQVWLASKDRGEAGAEPGGRRTAKAWPVNTSRMNHLAGAEPASGGS